MKKILLPFIDAMLGLLLKPLNLFRKDLSQLSPKRILVCRLDHIGDIIMTTPAFKILKQKYPEAEIFVLTNQVGKSLLKDDPHIRGFLTYPWPWSYDRENNRFTSHHWIKLFRSIREIRQHKFNMFIDFRGDLRMLLFFGFIPAIPYRIFYNRIGGKSLATHAIDHRKGLHELERVVETLKPIGIPEITPRPEIFLTAADYQQAQQHIDQPLGERFTGKYIVVSPYAANRIKEWTDAYWIIVVHHLVNHYGYPVYIIGSAENKISADKLIADQDGKLINLCGRTSLREVSAIISRASLVVGVDTGTLHIASCFEVPIISIFGPTDANQYRPYSPHCHVIDLNICSCDKDIHRICSNTTNDIARCMHALEPYLVCQTIDRLLNVQKTA